MISKFLCKFFAVLFAFFSIASSLTVIMNPWLFIFFPAFGIYEFLTFPWPFLRFFPDPMVPGRSVYWLTFPFRADFLQGILIDLLGLTLALAGLEVFLSSFITWLLNFRRKGGMITRGNYRATRHPQHFGVILLTLGLSIFSRRPAALIEWLTLTFSYLILASIEEEELHRIYGKEYAEYVERTPFMMPFVRLKLPSFLSNKSIYRYVVLLVFWIILAFTIVATARNLVFFPFFPPPPAG